MILLLFKQSYANYSLQNGQSVQKHWIVLYRHIFKYGMNSHSRIVVWCGTRNLIVPVCLQPKFIILAHDTHKGIVGTKRRLRELYWWPGMDAQVETAVKSFVTCQLHDKSAVTHIT